MAAVTAALLIAPAGASAQSDSLLAPESACPGQSDISLPEATQVQAMICMHRYARDQAGLSGLRVSKQLESSSARKASDIRRCQQFSHYACGRNPFYWFERVGFMKGSYGAGENLALGVGSNATAREMMDLWLNSPEHRANLLNPDYRNVGISLLPAKYRGDGVSQIWVAHFGYHH